MPVTMQDIADIAGVSIATVSHVINKTRYVNPELTEKIENIIKQTGYEKKLLAKGKTISRTMHQIAFVVDKVDSFITQLIATLKNQSTYSIAIYLSSESSLSQGELIAILDKNANVSLVILYSHEQVNLASSEAKIPQLYLQSQQKMKNYILSDVSNELYRTLERLVNCGHENICVIYDDECIHSSIDYIGLYKKICNTYGLKYQDNILNCTHSGTLDEINWNHITTRFSAVICMSSALTFAALTAFADLKKAIPSDISLIGFKTADFSFPAHVTYFEHNYKKIASVIAQFVIDNQASSLSSLSQLVLPLQTTFRNSIEVIGRGPFGEKAFDPSNITLTKNEIQSLQTADYKVALSLHYGGTAWANLHEQAIRETLAQYSIKVIAVTDAHFDPNLQNTQLDGIAMQKPDGIIAIPSDDKITAQKFKQLSDDFTLVFLSNVPEGLQNDEYACCVSVNERQNGYNAAVLLGEHFSMRNDEVKIGLICHGMSFYGTQLRDQVAEQTLRENYDNINITSIGYFNSIEESYSVCKNMLVQHPDIEALYISWDLPALAAFRAIDELHRHDLSIVTFDLDTDIARYLAKQDMVIGLSTQQPYEQGVAVARAMSAALLGKTDHKHVAVPPCIVRRNNLGQSWKKIWRSEIPTDISKYAVDVQAL